ncbi:MAG: Fe-S cluster protein [Deltaproteobacteria bacterium]|nr:Fe-S cluster protein [Deltaproteobacteria bacterium]
MLLKSYTKEIFNNECMPSAMSVQCFAHLNEDVGQALPYLNASLGGHFFIKEPPSVTFKVQGKLITVHSKKIAINALKDEVEATKIIEWLKREINSAWDKRHTIEPSFESAPAPKVIDILRLLPKSNCGECGQATCMVFAALMADGVKVHEDCPALDDTNRSKLSEYIGQFSFDI